MLRLRNRRPRTTGWRWLAAAAALSGCGGSNASGTGATQFETFRGMGDMYGLYLREHNDQPPRTEQEYRDFLGGKSEILEKLGLTVETMFVSPRNGAPLAWVYGKRPPRGSTGMTYIAYEAAPVDGKRFMLAAGGMHEEIDDAQFRKLFPGVR